MKSFRLYTFEMSISAITEIFVLSSFHALSHIPCRTALLYPPQNGNTAESFFPALSVSKNMLSSPRPLPCGFVRPSEGEILVKEKKIGKDMDFIPDAGLIIETPGFIPYYSGIKNLRLLASILPRRGISRSQFQMLFQYSKIPLH